MREFINLLIKGVFVGVANIIPGVSGGTIAFVLGIYEKLTEAVGYFFIKSEKRKEYLIFLGNLGIGIILGILLFAKLISFLLGVNLPEGSPVPFSYVPTFGFFLGLIIGSIPVLFDLQKDTKPSAVRIFLLISGIAFLFAIASLRNSTHNIVESSELIKDFGLFKIVSISVSRGIWLFFVGILAAFTMVVPGISGSALLVALGEYGSILNYIFERSVLPIGIFGGGIVVGIIMATIMMSKLLEYKPGATFYFILGLIGASCIQIVLQMINSQSNLISWIVAIPTLILGIVLALLSSKLQVKKAV